LDQQIKGKLKSCY